MYSLLLEQMINEELIKPKEVTTFGSNISKYDDNKIGYNSVLKSYFVVFPVDDGFVGVAVSRVDGTIRYTYSQNAYIGRMLHLPISNRRQSLIEAFNYMPQILFCLSMIIKSYHMRFPKLRIISRFTMQDRYHRFLLRSPSFKMLVKKYRFNDITRSEAEMDDAKVIIYDILK